MVAFGKTYALCVAAIAGLVQFCPAPNVIIDIAVMVGVGVSVGTDVATTASVIGAMGAVAGTVEGGISAAHSRRDKPQSFRRQAYNQLAWDECNSQLTTASVTFSAPAVGSMLVEGVPSACMTLLTVITGNYDAGNPVPQGSDSVLFSGMSDSDLQAVQDALNARSG